MTFNGRGTMEGLVDDLLRKPPNSLRDDLVRHALAGTYHDFKSSLSMPKAQLVYDLEHYGYRDLARRARRGEYDDAPDEADDDAMRKIIASNPTMVAAWRELQRCSTLEQAVEVIRKYLPPEGVEAAMHELGMHPMPWRKP